MNYLDMTDGEIKKLLAKQRKLLRDTQKFVKELEAETERRELEAYWLAHPGMRLNVGDEVLVTINGNRRSKGSRPSLNSILVMNGVDKNYVVLVGKPYAFRYRFDVDTAREMREAYLANPTTTAATAGSE